MYDEISLLPLRKDVEYIPILHGKNGQLPLPRMRKEEDSVCKASKKRESSKLAVVGKGLLLLAGWWAVVTTIIIIF